MFRILSMIALARGVSGEDVQDKYRRSQRSQSTAKNGQSVGSEVLYLEGRKRASCECEG